MFNLARLEIRLRLGQGESVKAGSVMSVIKRMGQRQIHKQVAWSCLVFAETKAKHEDEGEELGWRALCPKPHTSVRTLAVHFNAVHLLCVALISTWVVSCTSHTTLFCTHRKWCRFYFKPPNSFSSSTTFLMAEPKHTRQRYCLIKICTSSYKCVS